MNFGYHPDYGLSDDLRMRVVQRAKVTNAILASAEYKVSLSSVYRWLKAADKKEESK